MANCVMLLLSLNKMNHSCTLDRWLARYNWFCSNHSVIMVSGKSLHEIATGVHPLELVLGKIASTYFLWLYTAGDFDKCNVKKGAFNFHPPTQDSGNCDSLVARERTFNCELCAIGCCGV